MHADESLYRAALLEAAPQRDADELRRNDARAELRSGEGARERRNHQAQGVVVELVGGNAGHGNARRAYSRTDELSMTIEPNHGLDVGQEIFMTIRKDGELVAIELQNGTLKRWVTEKADRENSL